MAFDVERMDLEDVRVIYGLTCTLNDPQARAQGELMVGSTDGLHTHCTVWI